MSINLKIFSVENKNVLYRELSKHLFIILFILYQSIYSYDIKTRDIPTDSNSDEIYNNISNFLNIQNNIENNMTYKNIFELKNNEILINYFTKILE
jgi:hypothetical protein